MLSHLARAVLGVLGNIDGGSLFGAPKIPAPPPPPPAPPPPPTQADASVVNAGAASRAAAAAATGLGLDGTIKTGGQGAAAGATDQKKLLGE